MNSIVLFLLHKPQSVIKFINSKFVCSKRWGLFDMFWNISSFHADAWTFQKENECLVLIFKKVHLFIIPEEENYKKKPKLTFHSKQISKAFTKTYTQEHETKQPQNQLNMFVYNLSIDTNITIKQVTINCFSTKLLYT